MCIFYARVYKSSCQSVCLQVRCEGVYQGRAEGRAQIKLEGENNLHHLVVWLFHINCCCGAVYSH